MATKPERIVRKEQKRIVKVNLTNDELLSLGDEMASAQQRIAELEADLASFKEENKSKVAQAEAIVHRNSNLIRQRYESRDIPCIVTRNWDTERMTVVRKDTGETIEDRKMTSIELSELPMGEDKHND